MELTPNRANEELRLPLAEVRKDLLDFGLRNPLLNYRLLKTRGLEIPETSPAEVFRLLVSEGAELSFLPIEGMQQPGLLYEPESGSRDGRRSIVRAKPGRRTQTPQQGGFRSNPNELPTGISEKELEKRLLATYYAAKSSIEEQGVNTLFIALGMLIWRDFKSADEVRRAPLLLIPVELERLSAGEGFRLKYSGDDVAPNVCLLEYLKQSFGLVLDELSDSEEIDVDAYFYSFGKAVSKQEGWSVDPESIALGFFSFAKFLMYRDLDPATWDNESLLLNHDVLTRLLGTSTFAGDSSPLTDDSFVDDEIPAASAAHVVDADSTQSLAINDVLRGLNMVIQGPPGTGKSQTIVNLIAGALASGQKVLFVAEKKAALEVVKSRLDRIGLGAACLELHSNKIKKKEVIGELKQTAWLQSRAARRDDSTLSALEEAITRLNEYCNAVNAQVGNSGETIRDLYGLVLPLFRKLSGTTRPRLEISDCLNWTSAEVHCRRELVARLQERLSQIGIPCQHTFWGSQLRVVLPSTKDGIQRSLLDSAEAARALNIAASELAAMLGQTPPESHSEFDTLCASAKQVALAPPLKGIDLANPDWLYQESQIEAALSALSAVVGTRSRWKDVIRDDAWPADVSQLQSLLNELGNKWWRVFSPRWKHLKREVGTLVTKPLSQSNGTMSEILEAIRASAKDSAVLASSTHLLKSLYGVHWAGEQSDASLLRGQFVWLVFTKRGIHSGQLSEWCLEAAATFSNKAALLERLSECQKKAQAYSACLSDVFEKLKLDSAPTGQLRGRLTREWGQSVANLLKALSERTGDLDGLAAYMQDRDRCKEEGLERIALLSDEWKEAEHSLLDLFEYTRASALLETGFQNSPVLASFDVLRHKSTCQSFQELDMRHIELRRDALAKKHVDGLPRNGTESGQISVLWREFEKKSRHMPVRKLIIKAGNVVQAIKPVFLMSPLSVANFLPPGTVVFDLVIFDEASQVKPADALGAIVRGKQSVVVGDSKQLPPTSFFETMVAQDSDTEDDDAVATTDIESILGLFCSRRAHQRMLRWHYRSKHESLIAGSNHLFYENRLVVFPSPDRNKENVGLVYRHIENAHYDRSRTRTNAVEARAVAEAVISHAKEQLKRTVKERLTLGVAALSVAQRDAILDQLEMLRRVSHDTEEFFLAASHEPFFVKNLENVQGDERDVIFISIGYARTAEGYWANSFGPVNRAGGERRLNVLFSRARIRCEVFTAIRSEDINTDSGGSGVSALKTFLSYAEHGHLDVPFATGRASDSPFEEDVVSALQKRGYTVHTQVGSAGFFLDLAVVDPNSPGRYLLGVECDGAAYHSARSARDRDRLRQTVLESLGWRIHRIWSTAWFRAPEKEMNALVSAIEEAKRHSGEGRKERKQKRPAPLRPPVRHVEIPSEPPPLVIQAQSSKKYMFAKIRINLGIQELHEISQEQLANWLVQVVSVEGPIHWLEAAKRIADAVGVQRVGNRIQMAFQSACSYGHVYKMIENRNGFLWTYGPVPVQVRDRSDFPPQQKKIEYVAPEEICAAIEQTVKESFGMAADDVAVAACRRLGFARVTEEMRATVEEQRDKLVKEGRLEWRGETLVLSQDVPVL
jgi:very-short-patch-repair endonuclease